MLIEYQGECYKRSGKIIRPKKPDNFQETAGKGFETSKDDKWTR